MGCKMDEDDMNIGVDTTKAGARLNDQTVLRKITTVSCCYCMTCTF